MTTYNTGNAIGSTSPKDLYDNAENLDVLLLDQEKLSHPDRLGVPRWTWHGMEERFAELLANSGFQFLADYAPTAGIEITEYNQVLRDSTGNLWRLDPTVPLPYTTDGSGMPEGGAFLSDGDASALAELDQFKADLSDPSQGGDLVSVTTTTGTQTLSDALDSRVIYRSSKAELDSISPSILVDGQQAMVLGTSFTWNADQAAWLSGGSVNVKSFGAVGDGVADDGPAIRSAIESMGPGATLEFPEGHYKTTYGDPSVLSDWILIEADGASLKAAPGTVVLENFLIAVRGTFEPPVNVGSVGFTVGDDTIRTATAHGLSAGDVVQFLSQRNCYSIDGGDYQLGSREPNDNILNERAFSEMHVVQEVTSTTSFKIDDTVFYPDYADNVSGLNDPMTGVTSARVRKVNAVRGVRFEGIEFRNSDNDFFRTLYSIGAFDLAFDDCVFVGSDMAGNYFRSESSKRIRFTNCRGRRDATGSAGSSFNSFFVSAGTHGIVFEGCEFSGGAQMIDTSPLDGSQFPFYDPITLDGLSVQVVRIRNCEFTDGNASFTAHPGTYDLEFTNNSVVDCASGIFSRALKNRISDNSFIVPLNGIFMSGFVSDTIISGNKVTWRVNARRPAPVGSVYGINVAPTATDVMSRNNISNFLITGNEITIRHSTNDRCVRILHSTSSFDPSFTEFTDAIKTAPSDYVIVGNVFDGGGVDVYEFVNGVTCMHNHFNNCNDSPAYFRSLSNSVRHRVGGNTFDGVQPPNGVITNSSSLTYSYTTSSRVSGNRVVFGAVNNSLVDTGNFTLD